MSQSAKHLLLSLVLSSAAFATTRSLLQSEGAKTAVPRDASTATSARNERFPSTDPTITGSANEPTASVDPSSHVPVPDSLSALQEMILHSDRAEVKASARHIRNGLKKYLGMSLDHCWPEASNDPFFVEVSTRVVTRGSDITLEDARVLRTVGGRVPHGFLACASARLGVPRTMVNAQQFLAVTGALENEERFIFRSPEMGACAVAAPAVAPASAVSSAN